MNKKLLRFLSFVLTFLMLLGALTCLSTLTAFAADDDEESPVPDDYSAVDYVTKEFKTPEDKIAFMGDPYFTSSDGSYEMYVNSYTGEVAVKDTASGQVLFTNPNRLSCPRSSSGIQTTIRRSSCILTKMPR